MMLYVWTGVFTDYTSGMAVAIAVDERRAIELIADESDSTVKCTKESLAAGELEMVDLPDPWGNIEPQAWAVYGGS